MARTVAKDLVLNPKVPALVLKLGLAVAALRKTLFPYLTNVEGIKLATLAFEKGVAKLSCCAG